MALEFGIEKLKTMGDAYMAVAGAPLRVDDHAAMVLRAAQGMLAAAATWRGVHAEELELRSASPAGRLWAASSGDSGFCSICGATR